MRRSPRQGKETVSFETLQSHVQQGQVEEARAALLAQEKAARLALLAQRDEGGWTLFHLACQLGKLQLAFVLLDLGADVNATTPNGATGLHFLALLSKEEASPSAVYLQLLAELLKKGASLSLVNAVGESVLHLATSRKNELAVGFFIEAGCDMNLQTKQGETALHYAVSQNCSSVVSLLLGKGAQDRPNSSSLTAEQSAKSKHPDLVALFQLPRASRGSNAQPNTALSRSQRLAVEPRSIASSPASASNAMPLSPNSSSSSSSDEIVAWEVPEADPFSDENLVSRELLRYFLSNTASIRTRRKMVLLDWKTCLLADVGMCIEMSFLGSDTTFSTE